MFNISQYLVNKHMHEKYPRAFDEDISKEEFAAIVLKSMEEVGVSDSIFKAFKNNGFYSGNLEIGEELGQQDNKDIIGTDENTEFHKQVFIRQIKENNIIEDEDYQRLEQDALLMRRLENSIGYEKFKQKTIGVIENYAVPTLYMVGGTVELVTAGGVEVVGCGTGFLCVPATVLAGGLVADGTDNIATGYYNWGKDFEEQTSSFVLTKVYGVSEEDANTIKLYAGFASMGGELGIAVNASRAANASPGLFIASRSPDASPELFVAIDKNQVVEKLDNLSQNASALNSIKPPVDDLPQSNTYNLVTTIDNPRPHMTVNPDEIIKGSVSLDAKGLFRSENGTPLNLTNTIIKDHNGYHRVFTAPTGVEVIDLTKGSNLVGEVQYMENIAPTLSTQNSGGVLSTIKTAFGFNKTNSSLPSGWEDLKDGTILTSSGSRVNRTEELYQVDGVTYEVFNNTSNGEKIIALPDGVEFKGNGSFINKRDVSPSGSQNTDAVDSLSDAKNIPDVNKERPETPTNNHTYDRNNGVPDPVSCSFRGDMMVKTIAGFKPIEQIQIGELVWSRNQITGLMSFNKVLQTINSIDPDTAYVTITDEKGNSQTIVSDSRHPYFGNYGDDSTPPKPSPEKDYLGDMQNAYWINAGDLEVGHKVLDDDGNWQTVTSVRVEQTPLNSYNLEVNSDHTFFIRGIGGLDGIWVHNKNCFDELPKDVGKPVRIDGKDVYTIKDPLNESKTVKVILNPDEAARARGEVYVEVDVKPRKGEVTIKEPNKPTNTFLSSPPRTIIAEAGQKGNWNRLLNNYDQYPNATIRTTRGQEFKIDSQGRVENVTAKLFDEANDRNGNQQVKAGGSDRLADDHGGHLLAAMFGGPGEGINLVAMNKKFNGSGGDWGTFERRLKEAKDRKQDVIVNIKPVYSDTSKRPDRFDVEYSIGGGSPQEATLYNQE